MVQGSDKKRVPSKKGPANLEEARTMWRSFMSERGLNASKARDAVVDVFLSTTEHSGLQDLYRAARRRHAGVGFATVYRTMKLLEEAELAHARQFGTGKTTLYEVALGSDHHDHLICERCGRIVEFFEPRIEAQQEKIAAHYGYSLLRHRHELYGICADCRRSSTEKSKR
jgi:Fur family ferric uptake transcriptional regulator